MNIYEGNFKNNNYHVAIVASKFNETVTHHLVDGAIATLKQFGVLEDQIDIYWVPGAFEIGFTANKLLNSNNYDGIMTLGERENLVGHFIEISVHAGFQSRSNFTAMLW